MGASVSGRGRSAARREGRAILPMYPSIMELEDVLTVLDALERVGVRVGAFGGFFGLGRDEEH